MPFKKFSAPPTFAEDLSLNSRLFEACEVVEKVKKLRHKHQFDCQIGQTRLHLSRFQHNLPDNFLLALTTLLIYYRRVHEPHRLMQA
jgi:hypothetical protein